MVFQYFLINIQCQKQGSEIGQPFFKDWIFIDYYTAVPLKMYGQIKMDFGQPNAEIGRKMANG